MTNGPSPSGGETPLSQPINEALDELLRSLRTAAQATEQLRAALSAPQAAPARPALVPVPRAEEQPARPEEPPAPAPEPARERDDAAYSAFERLWERMETERMERQLQETAGQPERRGLDLLPQVYLMTVEDREHRVQLVPLHRALQQVPGIDEFTLVSFANGVPVVSIRAGGELDLERLRDAVGVTMRRQCELIPQDSGRIYLRLVPQEPVGV